MPYEFDENAFELKPDASSARSGGPPRKLTGIGALDPPVPPKRFRPESLFLRVLGGLLLLGIAGAILFWFFAKR